MVAGGSAVTGNIDFAADNKGVTFYGGGRVTKRAGAGMALYKPTSGAVWQICNADGTGCANLTTTTTELTSVEDIIAPLLARIEVLEARLMQAGF